MLDVQRSCNNWNASPILGKKSTMKSTATKSGLLAVPLTGLPTIRLAGRFPLDDRGFSVRYLAPFVSLHLYHYSGTIRIGRHEYAIKPGDVTLTPSGVPGAYDLPAPGYHLCVHFTLPRLRGPSVRLPLHLSLGLHRDVAGQRLSQVIQHHTRAGRSAASRAAASAGLLELLLWLSLAQPGRDAPRAAGASRAEAAVDRAVTLLDQSLDEPLDVPALSDAVELSQNYLAQHFRRRFGMTLQRYLLIRRIELAQHLLSTTNLPVHRIGERVGLPDPQHFNKQFRRLVGMSPTQVRETAAKAQADWPGTWRAIRAQLETREQ